MAKEIRLSELGENISHVQVVRILAKQGEDVEEKQPVLEVESDKAIVEVPASEKGKIERWLIREGDSVSIGQPIYALTAEETAQAVRGEEQELSMLAPTGTSGAPIAARSVAEVEPEVASPSGGFRESESVGPAPAGPYVLQLARRLNVDLGKVRGSGPGGQVTAEDVERSAFDKSPPRTEGEAPGLRVEKKKSPRPAEAGATRVPLEPIRKRGAEHVQKAWSSIPHVTLHEKADMTQLESFRKRQEMKPTVTALLVKIVAGVLRGYPRFTARLDWDARELVYGDKMNIGVAVDTSNGLMVPVIHEADGKSVADISRELAEKASAAREGRLSPSDMQGGVFSITNLGGMGTSDFNPIINSPEVAILGVGRAVVEPSFVSGGNWRPRLMLPLSLSFDHRVIDGAEAARLLHRIASVLQDPYTLLLI